MPSANPALVALLQRWTSAAQDANHSSGQPHTFRKACKGLAAHPTPITTREEALAVKFVGPSIAASLGDFLAFERVRRQADVRLIAQQQFE